MPSAGLIRVHGDPEHPVPAVSDHALLSELPAEAIERFVATVGPGSGSTLMAAELRQLGGALGRPAPGHGALPMIDGAFGLFAVGMALDEQMGAAMFGQARRLTDAMAPWSEGRSYLNFAETPTDSRTAYGESAYERLRAVRRRVDPAGLMHANHAIAAA